MAAKEPYSTCMGMIRFGSTISVTPSSRLDYPTLLPPLSHSPIIFFCYPYPLDFESQVPRFGVGGSYEYLLLHYQCFVILSCLYLLNELMSLVMPLLVQSNNTYPLVPTTNVLLSWAAFEPPLT